MPLVCGISTSEGQGETGPHVNQSSAFCAEMQQVHINQTNGFFSSFHSFQLHLGGCLFGLCVLYLDFFCKYTNLLTKEEEKSEMRIEKWTREVHQQWVSLL